MRRIRVLHLAVAEGRGHIVRAHRLRELFAGTPVDIEIATTHASGRDFLGELGTPSRVLPGGMSLPFDARHGMQVAELRARMLRYLRSGLLADVRALAAYRADWYINDSFHPALLGGFVDSRRVVLLHGDTMEEALLGHFDRTPLSGVHRAIMSRVLGQARYRILHSAFETSRPFSTLDDRVIVLPPLLPGVRWSDKELRRSLGAADRTPIACVYLNPHYRDPTIADAIERALLPRFHVHAVGEGYAGRDGWRGADPDLSEVIARSSLFVSGAGMASIAEARRAGVPLLVLEGDQPEQTLNIDRARSVFPPDAFASVSADSLDSAILARSIARALASLRVPPAHRTSVALIDAVAMWRNAFGSIFQVPVQSNTQSEVFPHAA